MSYRPYAAIIAEAQSGSGFATIINMTNDSGSMIPVLYGVSSGVDGQAKATDVAVESDALSFVGIAVANIPDSSSGQIIISGKLENITTSMAFGDPVYLAKTGGLTSTKPSIGVGGFSDGDFVIRIGVIARNTNNPSNKDLIISFDIEGQL